MTEFTEQQLADFAAFRKVQSTEQYNMLDPRARKSAGLTSSQYLFVLSNYDQLQRQSEKRKEASNA